MLKAIIDAHDRAALDEMANAAIDLTVDDAYPTLGETHFLDIIGDGATYRWLLTGNDIRILEEEDQPQPQYPDTAQIAAPILAPVLAPNATGSNFAAGQYTVGYRYHTAFGFTPPSPLATIVLAAAQSVQVGALTLPTTELPITQVDIMGSPGPYDPRLIVWASFTPTQAVSPMVISTLPTLTSTTTYYPQQYAGAFTALGLVTSRNGVMVEQQTDLNGNYVDGSAVISASAPLTAGSLVRVWYNARAVYPKEDGDVIRLENGYLRMKGMAYLHQMLAGNVSSGDVELHSKQAAYWDGLAEQRRAAAERMFPGTNLAQRELW